MLTKAPGELELEQLVGGLDTTELGTTGIRA